MEAVRVLITFLLLLALKIFARTFYRFDYQWVGDFHPAPFKSARVMALLNHTSLYEPLFGGILPLSFLWRMARYATLPGADKTLRRPVAGRFYKFAVRRAVPITRERDETWENYLSIIDDKSIVLIAPEGRMMRKSGLDATGKKMTVRGGTGEILERVGSGILILVYSGGLHHVQAPGERFPRLFKTLSLKLEAIDIASYVQKHKTKPASDAEFRARVRDDLQERRNRHCPPSANSRHG